MSTRCETKFSTKSRNQTIPAQSALFLLSKMRQRLSYKLHVADSSNHHDDLSEF